MRFNSASDIHSTLVTPPSSMTDDAQAAEELTRSVFADLREALADYEPALDGPFRAWLLETARETAVERRGKAMTKLNACWSDRPIDRATCEPYAHLKRRHGTAARMRWRRVTGRKDAGRR
jgi:DNA-directed RNA polymerase specialized sigma24 family protein